MFYAKDLHFEELNLDLRNIWHDADNSHYIPDAEAYALFVATAGEEFEAHRKQIEHEGGIFKQFAIDMLGSEITEAAERLQAEALSEEQALRGYKISNS